MDTVPSLFALLIALDAQARRWDLNGKNGIEDPDCLPWIRLQDGQESSNKRDDADTPKRMRLLKRLFNRGTSPVKAA